MKSFLPKSIFLRTAATFIVFACLSLNANSQIDSVNVDITFTSEIDSTITDSLGNYVLVDVMNVNTSIYDIDYMGQVIVTIYEGGTSFPLGMMKMTDQEFVDENLKVGSTVTMKLFGVDPSFSYRVETQVRNFQGANFSIVSTNYSL